MDFCLLAERFEWGTGLSAGNSSGQAHRWHANVYQDGHFTWPSGWGPAIGSQFCCFGNFLARSQELDLSLKRISENASSKRLTGTRAMHLLLFIDLHISHALESTCHNLPLSCSGNPDSNQKRLGECGIRDQQFDEWFGCFMASCC